MVLSPGFTDGCQRFDGPNPLVCYQMLWTNAGCDELGHQYPGNQSFAMVNGLNLKTIE